MVGTTTAQASALVMRGVSRDWARTSSSSISHGVGSGQRENTEIVKIINYDCQSFTGGHFLFSAGVEVARFEVLNISLAI